MKRFTVLILLLMLAFTLTGCSARKNDTSVETPNEQIESGEAAGNVSGEIAERMPENNISLEAGLPSETIKEAITEANKGKYLPGECHGVGYKIIETFREDDILSVYALTEYIEYGFQDNVLVNISGTNPKVLMRFRVTENNDYDLIFYTRLDLLSGLSEEELEELIQPLTDTGSNYLYTEQDIQEIRAQADKEAAEYLRSINRTADVGIRQSHEGQLLEEMISNESLLQELFKDDKFSCYPDWMGTSERIENGERYIYETAFDEKSQEITYTKIDYDTNTIVESTIVNIQNGTH